MNRVQPHEPPVPPRPLFVPRGLVMLAALWVFASWVMLFGFRPPVQPQAASYGPSLEILFVLIGVGVAVGWPLLRLSARPSSAPVLQSLFDAIALFTLLQVVAWPLRLVSSWTLPRVWLIVAALATSLAWTAAVLALTQAATDRRTRTRAMAAAIVVAVLPVAVAMAGEAIAPTGSPLFETPVVEGPAGSWRWVVEALVPQSGPCLLARAAAPIPLDPRPSEWALVKQSALAALVLWTAVVFVRVRAPAPRPEPRPAPDRGEDRPDGST